MLFLRLFPTKCHKKISKPHLKANAPLKFILKVFTLTYHGYYWAARRLPGRRALVVVFIKNMLFEIIAFVVFECL